MTINPLFYRLHFLFTCLCIYSFIYLLTYLIIVTLTDTYIQGRYWIELNSLSANIGVLGTPLNKLACSWPGRISPQSLVTLATLKQKPLGSCHQEITMAKRG